QLDIAGRRMVRANREHAGLAQQALHEMLHDAAAPEPAGSWIQAGGTRSEASFALWANHGAGATTIFFGDELSHAPHQENVLFAIIWWSQRLINRRCSQAGHAAGSRTCT